MPVIVYLMLLVNVILVHLIIGLPNLYPVNVSLLLIVVLAVACFYSCRQLDYAYLVVQS